MKLQISPANPHFAQIGGAEGIDRLVEAFYRRIDSLPAAAGIRAMHAADLEPTKAILKVYLTEWMGGPKQYTPQRGLRGCAARTPRLPSERPNATRGCSACAAPWKRP